MTSGPRKNERSDMDFDTLNVGQSHRHALTRTLTETDNLLASALIMSGEALQLDAVFAARHAPSGERLFNSVFTLGLIIGISDRDFVPLAPNEGIEDAVFLHPPRISDTIREIGRASCRERVCQYV